jgi:hypothetical protein
MALLHSVCNVQGLFKDCKYDEDSFLETFMKECESMTPDERAQYLIDDALFLLKKVNFIL